MTRYWQGCAAALMMLWAAGAAAQTIRIGVVNSFSGPQAIFGDYTDKAARLYLKLHPQELPPGVQIELLNRDDGGPNPDRAKQLAQELIVRDKVQLLMGAAFTPVALAIAPLATEAKVPFVITNAATSIVTTKSPYIVRVSFTIWQSVYPLGQWAAKHFKRAYTLVSDYGPGYDAEKAFAMAFTAGGGEIVGTARTPLINPDFAPFMQRVKDLKPNALMVFVPSGKTVTAVMKTFSDLALGEAGIKLIGPGDIVQDDELPNMGDAALGTVTVQHYTSSAERPANKAFVEAWHKEYGASLIPNFISVAGWDAMAMIVQAVRAQNGKIDPDATMEIFKHYRNPDSPRGPIEIDPATRDIVQNEYLREVRKVGSQNINVELETVATALKDPGKELKPQ
jgi:branched-chain amino acid transport system substrate-binding protein